jgi:hypothetical protein
MNGVGNKSIGGLSINRILWRFDLAISACNFLPIKLSTIDLRVDFVMMWL